MQPTVNLRTRGWEGEGESSLRISHDVARTTERATGSNVLFVTWMDADGWRIDTTWHDTTERQGYCISLKRSIRLQLISFGSLSTRIGKSSTRTGWRVQFWSLSTAIGFPLTSLGSLCDVIGIFSLKKDTNLNSWNWCRCARVARIIHSVGRSEVQMQVSTNNFCHNSTLCFWQL